MAENEVGARAVGAAWKTTLRASAPLRENPQRAPRQAIGSPGCCVDSDDWERRLERGRTGG